MTISAAPDTHPSAQAAPSPSELAPQPKRLAKLVQPKPMAPHGILRPFPSAALRRLGPFVFLDTAPPQQWGPRRVIVPDHPHQGVIPIGLIFRGSTEHKDSLGNHCRVESGGMQWLWSGSGASHEEVLAADTEGVFHMVQLWVELPAHLQQSRPFHRAWGKEDIPSFADPAGVRRYDLFSGELPAFPEHVGPAQPPEPLLIAKAELRPNAPNQIQLREGWFAAAVVLSHSVSFLQPTGERQTADAGGVLVFEPSGEGISLESPDSAEVLLLSAPAG